jgi:hypothetical protein
MRPNAYENDSPCIATCSLDAHCALNFTVQQRLGATSARPHRRALTVKRDQSQRKPRHPGKLEGEKMNSISNRLRSVVTPRLAAILTLLLAALFAGVGSAKACGEPNKASAPAMPWMEHQDDGNWQPSIVGLWHVVYTQSNGDPFNQTFKMWHSDGIEFENALLPPSAGNICYGVWKQTGHRSVKLHHIGVIWGTDGKIAFTFTVDEENTVSEDGKAYNGSFEFNQFDPSGNNVGTVKGTTAAKRVTFKTPSTEVD